MSDVTLKVLRFLFEFIFSKVNFLDFIKQNKQLSILFISNIVLSVLYMYMAEQTIVRTNQYRHTKDEISQLESKVAEANNNNESLKLQITKLQKDALNNKQTVDSETIVNEYSTWVVNVRDVETDLQNLNVKK